MTELVILIDGHIVSVSDEEWIKMDEILKVLEQPFILTLKLQSAQFTVPDFFAAWTKLERRLDKESGTLATSLKNAMHERKILFTTNETILGAVYLSRYQSLLSNEEKQAAINHIIGLSKILEKVKNNPTTNLNSDDNVQATGSAENSDGDDEFEQFLHNQQQQERTSSNVTDISNLIRSYKPDLSVGSSSKITTLEYWKLLKYKYPSLYNIYLVC